MLLAHQVLLIDRQVMPHTVVPCVVRSATLKRVPLKSGAAERSKRVIKYQLGGILKIHNISKIHTGIRYYYTTTAITETTSTTILPLLILILRASISFFKMGGFPPEELHIGGDF